MVAPAVLVETLLLGPQINGAQKTLNRATIHTNDPDALVESQFSVHTALRFHSC